MTSAGFKDFVLMAWVKELQRWLGVEGCKMLSMAVCCAESGFAVLHTVSRQIIFFPSLWLLMAVPTLVFHGFHSKINKDLGLVF